MRERVFVAQLPNLIEPSDYEADPQGKRVRFRIRTTENGLEIFGDAQRPMLLEEILEEFSPKVIESTLCG